MLHDIRTGEAARTSILAGINKAADAVKTTMGPLGRYVTIDYDTFSWPLTTNDGVTVANNLFLKDKYENIGAKYVRQAAQKTDDIAGDGTTTASVLVQAIVTEGNKALAAGVSPVTLRRQIEPAVRKVLEDIQEQKKVIKQSDLKSLVDIASISSRDETLGAMIAELVAEIGADGVITIEDNHDSKTDVSRVDGLEVRGGLLSTFFVNHKAFQQAVYEQAPIVVSDHGVGSADDIVHLMRELAQAGHRQAILIAAQIEGDAMATIIKNRQEGHFDMLPLRVIAYGPIGEGYMRDICAATGATFITEKDGRSMQSFTAKDMGMADRVAAGAHKITFIGGKGDSAARVEELTAQLPGVRELEEESIRERIAKLQSKTASIRVGGLIDSEREEIKKRVEDAVKATKAALSDGIVTGGGAALFRAARQLTGSDFGTQVVREACQWPLKQIALNAAVELGKDDYEDILEDDFSTLDFRTGEVVDGYERGIIDPAKVVTTALQNAASSAVLFLLTEAAIVTLQDEGEEL